jgi:hypothetical protein
MSQTRGTTRISRAEHKEKMSIENNHDDFLLEQSSQEPVLDEAGERKAHADADELRAAKIKDARAKRNAALQSFLQTSPQYQLDREIDDNAIILVETITGTRLKTHSRDASQIVAFDRDGSSVSISDVMERFYSELPSFRDESAQALVEMKADVAAYTAGDSERVRNEDGTFAKVAPGSPGGPSALSLPGFEQDSVMLEPAVNRARAEVLRYFTPEGIAKVSPLDDARFRELLLAAQPSGYASGTLISSVEDKFVTATQDKFARCATTEQLAEMPVDEFRRLTNAQKTVIIGRIGGASWRDLLAERSRKHSASSSDPFRGTKLENVPDDVRTIMLRDGLSREAAERKVELQKKYKKR